MTKNLKSFKLWNKAVELFLTAVNVLFSVIGITFLIVCLFYPERWNQTFTFEKKERYVQPPFRDSLRTYGTKADLDSTNKVW